MADVLTVFAAASVTAVTTGLGALPFIFYSSMHPRLLGLANALAAGMMLGASITLFLEGLSDLTSSCVILNLGGLWLGVLLMVISRRSLESFDEAEKWSLLVGKSNGVDARRILLVYGAMLVHSFAEGVSIGISFAGSDRLARMVTLSLAIHNIPEGLAISIVLIRQSVPVSNAAMWCIVSSLPQPLMAIPAFVSVQFFKTFLPLGLGFASGAMGYVCLTELIPESRKETKNDLSVFTVLVFSALLMLWISTSSEWLDGLV